MNATRNTARNSSEPISPAPAGDAGLAEAPQLLTAMMAFPSPLLWFQLPDAEALNAAFMADTQSIRSASAGVTRSNQGGWHSESDLFRRQEGSYRLLCQHIQRCVMAATQRVAPKFELKQHNIVLEGWVNVNPTHAFNAPHRHSGFLWSGSYYVSVPQSAPGQRSGMIEFFDPRTRDGTFSLGDAVVFASKTQFRPKPGTLVVFPSYLSHWVYPNDDAADRVSVAFNARFVRKGRRGAGTAEAA